MQIECGQCKSLAAVEQVDTDLDYSDCWYESDNAPSLSIKLKCGTCGYRHTLDRYGMESHLGNEPKKNYGDK